MAKRVTLSELREKQENERLEIGEEYAAVVDSYRLGESRTGDPLLFVKLVITDAPYEGVEVDTFGPVLKDKLGYYLLTAKAFGLTEEDLENAGIDDNSERSVELTGELISGRDVMVKAIKPYGDNLNSVRVVRPVPLEDE